MSRKALPRAIARKPDRAAPTDPVVTANAERKDSALPKAARPLPDALDRSRPSEPTRDAAATVQPESSIQHVEGEILPPLPAAVDPLAIRRRALAKKIVERYKLFGALGGLFPLPVANVAGVTAVIVRMVKALSDLYEVPFERDRTRSLIVGLVGGATPTGLGIATSSTLALTAPGAAFVGLAVSSFTAGAVTRGIGLAFIEHFESELRSNDVTQ